MVQFRQNNIPHIQNTTKLNNKHKLLTIKHKFYETITSRLDSTSVQWFE